ncbi:MAG: DUF1993 domain-containing protein [Steroidobacteraceae bacterium]
MSETERLKTLFRGRLETLEHLLTTAEEHFGDQSYFAFRIAPDMLPFGAQIAFTCDQPYNFARWCEGLSSELNDPAITSIVAARECVSKAKAWVANVSADDSILLTDKRIDLGPELYVELPGRGYVEDFLLPNFYFHLATAYDILRMNGVPLGKGDYMKHLLPLVRQSAPV